MNSKQIFIRFLLAGVVLSLLYMIGCTKALGVRNPNYDKKIQTIAILNFSGPPELSAQASSVFTMEVKELNVVGVYMPHQVQEFLVQQGLGNIDPHEAAAREVLASKLNIDAIFSGQVIQYDNTYRTAGNIEVIVRLTDIITGEQIYSATIRTDSAGVLTGEESEIIAVAIDSIIEDIKTQFDL